MKRVYIFLLILALFGGTVMAQNFIYNSLSVDFSGGLFPNPMDQALTVMDNGYGPGFGELDHNYLFGGVTNLESYPAGNMGGTFSTWSAQPLTIGLYRQAKTPWSFIAGLDFTTVTGEQADSETENYVGSTAVVNGTTTTIYEVLDTKTTTDFTPMLYDDLDVQAQFLTVISGISTGLYLNFVLDDEASSTLNYSQEVTNYYDGSATPGTDIPVPTADWSTSTTETDSNDSISEFTIAVPFRLDSGDMVHHGNLSYTANTVDSSTSITEELSIPSTNNTDVGAAVYDDDSTTEKAKTSTIGIGYSLVMPSFLSNHKESRFKAEVDLDIEMRGGESSSTDVNQTYSSLAGALVTGSRDVTETTVTVDSTMGFDLGVSASESIFHDFGPMVTFGMRPTVSVGFERAYTTASLSKVVNVNRTDGNGDDVFTDVLDTITTTTIEYTNTDTGMFGLANTDTLEIGFTMPTALKFKPEGWICGFILSDTPKFTFSKNTNTTLSSESKTTVHVIQGDGTGESTAITEANNSTSSSTSDGNWMIQNRMSLGAEFYLPNDILLVVDINGNLWEPEGFTIQAVVPADFLFKK